ncbi:unnamed protein product [Parnassius apollo]|uniref:(apollo) hypothetical protein n=1 Tax=Parnassius apollo TaxID=110799 RepID=A0A8S3WVV5_PARAO|nr:unnamed protein product [Parnassius apollo]
MYIISSHHSDENKVISKLLEQDLFALQEQNNLVGNEMVTIKLYYESLCPDCIQFITKDFKPVVEKLTHYLNIQTYPYGNARTFNHNGHYVFQCQHGPEECYGNKLHACAIYSLRNMTRAVLFNSCMMEPRQGRHGSDDDAADACGTAQNVDVSLIKECAKGNTGNLLLKYYGDESTKAHFDGVPYILLNGKSNDGDNFMRDVCAAFTNVPPPCREISME